MVGGGVGVGWGVRFMIVSFVDYFQFWKLKTPQKYITAILV